LLNCGGSGQPSADAPNADASHAEDTGDAPLQQYPATDGAAEDIGQAEPPCVAGSDGWCRVSLPVPVDSLESVWGASADHVWVVASNGAILEWYGSKWTMRDIGLTTLDAGPTGWLRRVWGAGPNDVWAVGSGVVLHWNGSAWTTVQNDPSMTLASVWGTDASHVWMVGRRENDALILFWDGSTLSQQSITYPEFNDAGSNDSGLYPSDVDYRDLRDVWGTRATDVWAITGTTMFHWDGTSWTLTSHVGCPANTSRAIWGTDASHIWIVGGFRAPGYVLSWDGATWTQTPVNGDQLIGVWGRSDSEVWAVGGYGRDTVAKWDGTAWTTQRLGGAALSGVWGSSAGDLWAVGGDSIWYRRP